jgi:hypothetical protein
MTFINMIRGSLLLIWGLHLSIINLEEIDFAWQMALIVRQDLIIMRLTTQFLMKVFHWFVVLLGDLHVCETVA